jgi:hypothetical protein
MNRHPAVLLLIGKDDIIQALKEYIWKEYPEYGSGTHNLVIDTNLDRVEVQAICYTPLKEKRETDE